MKHTNKSRGFTLIELLLAMGVFLIICAAMFSLLQLSQQRYSSETQLSGTFQEARLAMDQIVRDVNDAGYPSRGMFASGALIPTTSYAAGPIAWSPNYPGTPCSIGATCTTPGDFDLILETTIGGMVSYIRYQLNGTTLMRGSVAKNGTNPDALLTGSVMVPFLLNVMNQSSGVPIFKYACDTPPPAGVTPCPSAPSNYNATTNIRDVEVTLMVKTQLVDAQTGQVQIIELNGRAHRLNPSN